MGILIWEKLGTKSTTLSIKFEERKKVRNLAFDHTLTKKKSKKPRHLPGKNESFEFNVVSFDFFFYEFQTQGLKLFGGKIQLIQDNSYDSLVKKRELMDC